jgi:antitoxin ParD1/3/4
MKVTLTPELEKLICDRVASGEFDSRDELVSTAIRTLLDGAHATRKRELLIRAVRAGFEEVERGEFHEYTDQKELAREIMEEGRALRAQGNKSRE